ncbi:hypothetical protein O3G_MSEX011233 [Manduca sexta]|uniref:Uncharacterized protein n=1 Tax=Manduca sexta TaxID=7130 RepID=A0A921ZKL5_MANSE|nr:hypothetical protein O3G_MSEX011233 [Manduca sexta]
MFAQKTFLFYFILQFPAIIITQDRNESLVVLLIPYISVHRRSFTLSKKELQRLSRGVKKSNRIVNFKHLPSMFI